MDRESGDENENGGRGQKPNYLMLPTVCAPRDPPQSMLPTVCVDTSDQHLQPITSKSSMMPPELPLPFGLPFSVIRTQSLDFGLDQRKSSSCDSAVCDQFSPFSDCFDTPQSTPGITLTPLDLRSPKRTTRFTFEQRLSSGSGDEPRTDKSPLLRRKLLTDFTAPGTSSESTSGSPVAKCVLRASLLRSHSDSLILPKNKRNKSSTDEDDPKHTTSSPLANEKRTTYPAFSELSGPTAFYCPTVTTGQNAMTAFMALNKLRLLSASTTAITRSLPSLPADQQMFDIDDPPKPFECQFCKKGFKRSDVYNRHMRTHTDERPYVCQICGRAFRRSDHVRTHIRTHTAEKPYSCPKCPYNAARSDVMGRHIKSHKRKEKEKEKRMAAMLTQTMNLEEREPVASTSTNISPPPVLVPETTSTVVVTDD